MDLPTGVFCSGADELLKMLVHALQRRVLPMRENRYGCRGSRRYATLEDVSSKNPVSLVNMNSHAESLS